MISGLATALLLVAFIGGCLWAWSPRRHSSFDHAARMALDDAIVPTHRSREETP